MCRFHLARNLVIALSRRLAHHLSVPLELVPVHAAGTSLTALRANTVRPLLVATAFVDHRSPRRLAFLLATAFGPTTFLAPSWSANGILAGLGGHALFYPLFEQVQLLLEPRTITGHAAIFQAVKATPVVHCRMIRESLFPS
jgi:hypothetical protein